jgi:hypothetical protein
MKYLPFLTRVVLVLIASVFIAKWLGVTFSTVCQHILWIIFTLVIYYLAVVAHLALDRFIIELQDKRN